MSVPETLALKTPALRSHVPKARGLVCCLLLTGACFAQELTIAAAADLQAAFPELAAAYEKKTGRKVRVSFGSSGNFFAQIQNGAPFDLFFSADIDYPQRLETAGLSKPGSMYVYAIGKIVVWRPDTAGLNFESLGLEALKDPRIKHIAIANPAHAPYGRAAKAAMEKAGVWDVVKDKIVLGENVSQAAQFVETGNAQVGIIALALTRSSRWPVGKPWLIPQNLYPKLEQAAIVLRSSKNAAAAEEFLAVLRSEEGLAIMRRFGFEPPQAKRARETKREKDAR